MRPIKITIEGINSFISPQTIDFTAVGSDNLFCISGSTGSGKTTILDSLILALYNKTEGARGNLCEYVNLRCETGKISFDFELDGVNYNTTRVIKKQKTAPGSFVLTNLDSGMPVCEGDEAYEFLKKKIGLDAKEFTKVVVLQQGEFARFLKSKDNERNDLMSKLFSLDKYKDLHHKINKVLAIITTKVTELDGKITDLEFINDESVRALETDLLKIKTAGDDIARLLEKSQIEKAELERKKSEWEKSTALLSEINGLEIELNKVFLSASKSQEKEKEIVALELEQKTAETERESLLVSCAKQAELLEKASELEKKEKDFNIKKDGLEKAKSELGKLKEVIESLKAEIEKTQNEIVCVKNLPDLAFFSFNGDNDAVVLAHRIDEMCRKKIELKKTVESAKTEFDDIKNNAKIKRAEWAEFTKKDGELTLIVERAKTTLDAIKMQYEQAQVDNAVASINGVLKQGDRCPVCNGVITKLSKIDGIDLARLKQSVTTAENEYETARSNKEKSERNITLTLAQISSMEELRVAIERRYESVFAEFKALNDILTEKAQDGARTFVSLCEKVGKTQTELAKLEREFEQKLTIIGLDEKNLIERERELVVEREKLGGFKRNEMEKLLSNARMRINEIEKNRGLVEQKRKEYDEGVKKIETAKIETEGKLKAKKEMYKPADKVEQSQIDECVKLERELSAKNGELRQRLGELATQIAVQKKELEKKKELLRRKSSLKSEMDKYTDLAKLFRGDEFRNFVISEYVRKITVGASKELSVLTGGKYTLTYENGEFFVYDFLAGNEKRNCKTLSGGETFLASLALAIAISSELSKSRNFDFFFIDEGFGTLSPDALDMVTSALQMLAKDTLVGVITHRGELIERISSIIKVNSPDGEDGSRISY